MKKEEYLALVEQANSFSYHYYTLDAPIATDNEYDELMKLIKQYEKENNFVALLSPTKRIGDVVLDGFAKNTMLEKMYSLNDLFNFDEMKDWFEKLLEKYPKLECYLEPKYDGLSLNLLYEDGVLTVATTRGDGIVGENVTENIPYVKGIPLSIPYKGRIEIRGEVTIFKEDEEYVNSIRVNVEGKDPFANLRNASAGSLRSYNSSEVRERRLKFSPYGIGYSEKEFEKQDKIFDWILTQGFKKWEKQERFLIHNVHELEKAYQTMIENRDSYPMLLDGMVVKANDIHEQEEIGFTEKHPKWAFAYKFPAREVSTKVKDINLQVGKTGAITPVAILNPTNIDGSTIERSSLHNFDEIERLDIRPGDIVALVKSGDVIPKITQVFKERRTEDLPKTPIPTECPVCGSPTVKEMNQDGRESPIIKCSNEECEGKLIAQLQFSVSKKAFDIPDVGQELVVQLFKANFVKRTPDLFSLTKEQLLTLEGVQARKASKILKGLESIKNLPLSSFITALSFDLIGERASTKIAEAYGLDALNPDFITFEKLEQINTIGRGMAQNYMAGLSNNLEEIMMLKEILTPTHETFEVTDNAAIAGKTFVITGTLSLPRKHFEQLVEQNGGKNTKTISGNTNYLLAGAEAGSKLDKAKSKGVTILDEESFMQMINGN